MRKFLLIFVMIVSSISAAYSQSGCSRDYIRNRIKQYGECKNVAITKTNGDVMLYGRNGWAATSCCPSGLSNELRNLNGQHELIDDVVLTEQGKWLILYGNNGFKGHGTPDNLWRKITGDFRNEVILSVTFNDHGDWIIITTDYYSASSTWITNWLKDGANEYGQLWAACVTNDAMVAVYARGYSFYGNVPEKLKNALRNSNLDVFRIKLAGSAWFFADRNGSYHYDM